MCDTVRLAEPPTPYIGTVQSSPSVVHGRLVRNGLPVFDSVPIFVSLELATTRTSVTYAVLRSGAAFGGFSFDAAAALAARFPGQPINLSDYVVVIRTGDGLQVARTLVAGVNLSADVNLGDVEVSLVPATGLVGLSGVVIDGQTQSSAVAGASIYLMKGRGQRDDLLGQVVDTTTTRRLTADALGRFSASGLEPGDYSALVTKAGYVSQTQGSVFVAASGSSNRTFSLLRVLAADQAAITLRWGASSDGALVSRDLDSHLKKFNSAGIQQYEIYFVNRLGSATDSLDRDDVDYQGPETITLTLDRTARYVYFVHNYVAGNGSLLGPSRPTVNVRIGQALREFSLPSGETGTQKFWKVFELIDGAVAPCASGCLTDSAP